MVFERIFVLLQILFFFFKYIHFFCFCFCGTCGMQKFQGQGSNLHHSSDLSHSSDKRQILNLLSHLGIPTDIVP